MNEETFKKEQTYNNSFDRLGTEKVSKLLVEFTIPAVLGILVNILYNIVDAIFVGHGVGDVGLAATTVAFPACTVLVALSMLIGHGGNSLCAIKLGEGKKEEAEKIFGNTFTMLVIAAVVVIFLGIFFMDWIVGISGATEESFEPAKQYISIIMFGFMGQSVGFGINNFIRTAGAPNRALFTMVIGAVVNIFLDALFVLVFKWGVPGAAWATIVSQFVSAVTVLEFFLRKNSPLKFHRKNFILDSRLPFKIMALGFSMFVMQAATVLVSIIANNLMNQYGALDVLGSTGAIAAWGVTCRTGMIIINPIVGFSIGAQPILGYNHGAKQFERVKRTWVLAIVFAVVCIFVPYIFMEMFPALFISLYGLDQSYMEFGKWSLRVYAIATPLIATQIVGSNYFQATGHAIKPSILTLTRQIIFLLPLLFICPQILPGIIGVTGLQSLYIACAISDVLSACFTGCFTIIEMRRLNKAILEQGKDPNLHLLTSFRERFAFGS